MGASDSFLPEDPNLNPKSGAHVTGSSGSGWEHAEPFTFAFTAIHLLT